MSGSEIQPDSLVDIDTLLQGLVGSLRTAAGTLATSFGKDWNEPYVYRIPRMQISVKLGLTYSKGKTKGLLIWKRTTTEEQSVLSTIDLELVAVPRSDT